VQCLSHFIVAVECSISSGNSCCVPSTFIDIEGFMCSLVGNRLHGDDKWMEL
jgi:hypothetical protein